MYICYFIDQDSGCVSLQYSCSNECELIKEFKEDKGASSCETISIETDAKEYFTEDAYRDLAKHLWKVLGNTPTDENGVDGVIDEDFLHFSKGECVYDIWHWFESEFDVCIANMTNIDW